MSEKKEIEIIETSFEWECTRNREKEEPYEWNGDVSGKTFWELFPSYVCVLLAVAGFLFGAIHRIFVG